MGSTVLLIEQNARSGLKIATRGVVMESGQVRLEGPGPKLLESPEIGRLYLGRAASAG
jgi:branched-chain amino acid transport system ATP-binding protein